MEFAFIYQWMVWDRKNINWWFLNGPFFEEACLTPTPSLSHAIEWYWFLYRPENTSAHHFFRRERWKLKSPRHAAVLGRRSPEFNRKGRWKGLFIRVLQTKFEFPAIEIDSNKDECEIDLLRENLIKLGIFFLCDWEIFSLHRPGLMDETAIHWLENGSDRYSRPNKCLSFKWIISQRVGLPQKTSENWFDLRKVRFRKWSWTLHGRVFFEGMQTCMF